MTYDFCSNPSLPDRQPEHTDCVIDFTNPYNDTEHERRLTFIFQS